MAELEPEPRCVVVQVVDRDRDEARHGRQLAAGDSSPDDTKAHVIDRDIPTVGAAHLHAAAGERKFVM